MVHRFAKTLALSALLMMLLSCGGGSESENRAPATPTGEQKIGMFSDGPVSGIAYISRSPDGKEERSFTDADGNYLFWEGGTIEFFLGNVSLGKRVTSSAFTSSAELHDTDQGKINLARLLKTLDADGTTINGIQISSDVEQSAQKVTQTVNFNAADFESKFPQIADQLGIANRELVSSEAAFR